MKRILLLTLCFATLTITVAGQGMWLPSLIENRIGDMKAKGFELSARDIYDINNASLKDGIVRFGSGCTGELISGEGLLLTNHHCGFGQIQNHSSVENDYLTNGFWARSRAEELPNPGLEVTFLIRMEDVTSKVVAGTSNLSYEDSLRRRDANIGRIIREAIRGTHYKATVEPFYFGNQYFLFVNEVFRDVRLVAAPPYSIGNFGGNTDNWMWPRHTGDFSIFRIYADKDNKPAEYSRENVPYKPRKFFRISTKGVKEGDFTMVYGFPARTQQYLHSAAVDYVLNRSNPEKIALRTMRLNVISAASEQDPAIRIAYASKAASIANAWKKWQGESLGLKRLGTIAGKQAYEARFEAWATDKPEYRGVIGKLQENYDELSEIAFAREYYSEAIAAIELVSAAEILVRNMSASPDAVPAGLTEFYKEYYPEIDHEIAVKLLSAYLAALPAKYIPQSIASAVEAQGGAEKYIDWLFDNSVLTDERKLTVAYSDPASKADLMNDPAVMLFTAFRDMREQEINRQYALINERITALYTTYVRGMMEFEPQRVFFPDANSTLRVAYGRVEGYSPEDAVACLPVSSIEGIIQKENPEIYDYAIPQSLRDIYTSKDYGRWGADGTMPVCFIATNHTTGGNSGSPMLNGRGELIGINFDRTWLSTMSDIEFDPLMCRNIGVDIRYVMLIIEKIGKAGHLLDEMVFDDAQYGSAE